MLDRGTRIPVRVVRSQNDVTAPSRVMERPVRQAQDAERVALLRKKHNVKKDDVDWKSVAARLQADMANYRKRQEGRASDEITREKQRLLREFLSIVDQFETILTHIDPNDATHVGVQLAYDALLLLLQREGVKRMDAVGTPFDPAYHEAVARIKADGDAMGMSTIVKVTQPGYTLDDALLRPARVVVAVPQ